jgi:transposase-like protein
MAESGSRPKKMYLEICEICGSFDVEYIGSNHAKWYCNNCKKDVNIKVVKTR